MDEIGKRYGKLVVIEKTEKRYHGTTIYKCLCDCGNYKEVDINKLHTGHTKSCGCGKRHFKDIKGQRFGRLVALEYLGTEKKSNYFVTKWKCKCDCGNECVVNLSSLNSGYTVSCGCKNEENKSNIKTIDSGHIDGTQISNIKVNRKLNKNNSSGVTGVTYDKRRKKWAAQITFKNKGYSLGRYPKKRDAIRARKEAEECFFGKYREMKK